MTFNFANTRRLARQVVHETLGVPALYQDNPLSKPIGIAARWTNKTRLMGDIDREGYAQTEEAVDRVVFCAADSAAIGCKRGGTITFPDYDDITFTLHERLPNDGPYDETWMVSRP